MVSHPTHRFSERRERSSSRLQSRSVLQPGSQRKDEPKFKDPKFEDPKFEEPKFSEKDLKAIRERYLGAQKVKKRVTKPSEKTRFISDWHRSEDTTQDTKPLYERPHDARLVFERKKDRFGDRLNVEHHHWSQKKLEEMTERDWRIFREDHNISYKGNRIRAHPMRNWEESGLIPELVEAVHKVGYKKPSPIQMAAIPISLQLQDMIGVAETGSGKTAAFVLPMLIHVSKLSKSTPEDGPHAVVMAPTRELVMQITSETEKFAQFLNKSTNNPRMVSIVGGKSIEEQSQKLFHGCEILIATPGRLLDCLERRYAVLNQCKYVVLDEADRMIDMGFEQQVRALLDAMPPKHGTANPNPNHNPNSSLRRTTVMFSATMPSAVERIAKTYLRDPVTVTIEPTSNLITQTVQMLQENEKFGKLCRLLTDADQKVLVFVNTRDRVETLTRDLDRHSYRVESLHGGKAQQERETALSRFRKAASGFECLIATDVAGRGIDIPDVAHVVNYDMPASIEQYTHRIGRTGRAGKPGVATTFLTPSDSAVYRDLYDILVQSRSRVPPELARHSRTSLGYSGSCSQERERSSL